MNIHAESHTQDQASSQVSALITDTGSVGRPRRNRYSKAAMLEDIVSIADPRMWPTYVAAALILAIPLYAVFSPAGDDASLARRGSEPQPVEAAEPPADESGPPIVYAGGAVPSLAVCADPHTQRTRIPAPCEQLVLVARIEGAQAKRPSRRQLPENA